MAALIDRELLQDSTFDGSSNDSVLTQLNVTPNPEISFPTQTNPATPADSNVALVETKIDYSLNINKALKKKIAACKQVKARAATFTRVNGTVSCFCNKRLQN